MKTSIFAIPALQQKLIVCLAIFLLTFTASLKKSHCYPLNFRDSSGRDIVIRKEPAKVVSLVPSIHVAVIYTDQILTVFYNSLATRAVCNIVLGKGKAGHLAGFRFRQSGEKGILRDPYIPGRNVQGFFHFDRWFLLMAVVLRHQI